MLMKKREAYHFSENAFDQSSLKQSFLKVNMKIYVKCNEEEKEEGFLALDPFLFARRTVNENAQTTQKKNTKYGIKNSNSP